MIVKILGTKPEISKKTHTYLGKYKASCLVLSNKTSILVNVGDDIFDKMKEEEIKNIEFVLITHGHSKAVDGIPKLDSFLEKQSKVIHLCASQEVVKLIELRYSPSNLIYKVINSKNMYKLGDIFVKPVKIFHTPDYPTLAFNFNGVFFYASDMSPLLYKSEIKYLKNNILAVIDGQYWNYQIISDNHFTVLKHLYPLLELNNRYTLFTGMGNQWPPLKEANKELKIELQKYKKIHLKCNIREIRTAKEGEKLSIDIQKLLSQIRERNKN